MRTFICTCGTSIILNAKRDITRFKNEPRSRWENFKKDIESIKRCMEEYFDKFDLSEDLNKSSAEIKSLIKIGINKDDKLILISSDTIDGLLCTELVKEFLSTKDILDPRLIEIEIIEGLQAKDGYLFHREGIKKLLSFLIKLENENIVLNPTGGYKSVVPYIALIGMLFNKPVQYIHEDSDDIITLTNLPIKINEDIIFKIEDKLRKIEKETAIPLEEWKKGIDYNDHSFDCLVEEYNDNVTLSGIGLLFWERFKQDFPDDLLRDNSLYTKKYNKLRDLGINHHGMSRILPMSEKILQSPFVKSVLNSCNNMPKTNKWITPLNKQQARQHIQIESEAICIVTDIKSDAGYSFLIETTARNFEENKKIADILNSRFN